MSGVIYEPSGKAKEYADLALNLYRGCAHACAYCYVPQILRMSKRQFHFYVTPKKNVINRLEEDVKKMRGEKRPVLLSFSCDPYQPIDESYQLTRRAIRILKDNDMRITILTKGGLLANRDFDLLDETDFVGATLTFQNVSDSLNWEPNASLPEERLQMLRDAKKNGFGTWVSFEPIISPEQVIELIKKTHDFVDEYKIGKLNYHSYSQQIDWSFWTREIVDCIRSYGKTPYVKESLKKYL